MDESPWWPKGIITEDSEGFASGRIQTLFGTLQTWDYSQCLDEMWWNSPPQDGTIWGQWPNVTNLSEIRQDRKGYLLRLNETQIARITPFALGNDLSRLVQYEPWFSALDDSPLVLPSMVYFVGKHDRIAVYECPMLISDAEALDAEKLANSLGSIHNKLHVFSTPNTERRWNERLQDIEAELKVTTLWRAPHSQYTVGLPRLNVDIEMLTKRDDELMFIADIRTPVEHLLCQADRLPGLANLMLVEQQISFLKGMNEATRKVMLDAWLSKSPKSYGNKKAVSTLLGGPWIWRYHAVLLALGEARIYADEELGNKAQRWLDDVSRIQAHLGVLRLWKSGLWGGVVGAVIAFFAGRMGTISPSAALITGCLCVVGAIVCNVVYWSKDPQPY